jgi:pilus assembly protein CpaC
MWQQISNKQTYQLQKISSLFFGHTNIIIKAALALALILVVNLAPIISGNGEAQARTKIQRLTNQNKIDHIRLVINKSETIKIGNAFAEIQLGNSEIADVLPLSDTSFYILGKKIGATNLSIYDQDRKLIAVIDVEVSFDVPQLRSEIRKNLPNTKIRVSSLNGNILLTGTAPSASAVKQAGLIAEQFAPKAVTSSIAVSSSQQVLLEVRFIEASRTAGRELGVNFNANGKGVAAVTGVNLLSGSTPFGAFLGSILGGSGLNVDILIDALEDRGLARRLAEPNLIALSGDTASFLAGGEFPFPVGADNGEITIEFKKFGVGLTFSPTVLPDGIINIEIEPEVSQLDPTNTLRLNGFDIPSLIVRRAHTTVELRDGQSFAIAGLLQSNHSKALSQLPWVGDVPVLGALFRSSSFQKEQTELVIIITPHLVEPAAPHQKLASPLDSVSPANDIDFFLFGKVEVSKATLKFFENGGRTSSAGHIIKGKELVKPRPYLLTSLGSKNTHTQEAFSNDH